MTSKKALRLSNYRTMCASFTDSIRQMMSHRDESEIDTWLRDWQARMDDLYMKVPSIADNQANFNNAAQQVNYDIMIANPNIPFERKTMYTEQQLARISKAPKRKGVLALYAVVILALLFLAYQVVTHLL